MRMRFTKAEQDAFTVGTVVEWRNGGHWHPGIIVDAIDKSGTFHRVGVKHTGRQTATVSPGAYIGATPTTVRLPMGK